MLAPPVRKRPQAHLLSSMLIVVAVVSAVSWVVRYRILNMYSRLPPEPQRKEPEIDLFPDTHDEGAKLGLSSYLDEFLSAIKIFGYLERSVFHELTRSMQTRKLIAGETINLEQEKGFCIVVDGLVEIFVKPGLEPRPATPSQHHGSDSSGDDEPAPGQQRYQLLTEVRNGAPMSSLFSIMSLFTEDIKLRPSDESPHILPSAKSDDARPASLRGREDANIPVSMPNTPQLDESSVHPATRLDNGLRPQQSTGRIASRIPQMSLDPSGLSFGRSALRPGLPPRQPSSSAHPDIIARATVDTTIAIIPASAFRRLIRVYPKATSHIVHVILSRFQRVTLSHAFNYLGLITEVLQTEKNMVKYTVCQLPNMLRGDALTRLKEKFNRERERIGKDEETKGIALHNAAANRRRRSSSFTLRKEAMLSSMASQRVSISTGTSLPPRDRSSVHDYRSNPGDLLAQTHLARATDRTSSIGPLTGSISVPASDVKSPLASRSFNPFDSQKHARISMDPRETVDEDNLFRASILECTLKSLGLEGGGAASGGPESMEGSPRLGSADPRKPRAHFTSNAFGSMGLFDFSGDGDSESVTSSGFAAHSPPSAQALANDLRDEVEIVFFPKGSVLVEQGERSPGLYYVVDGFLDFGTSSGQGSQDMFQMSGSAHAKTDPFMFRTGKSGESGTETRAPKVEKLAGSRRSVALIKPGGLAGYIGSISSYRSFIDVVAKTDVYVGFLPRACLERIVDRFPIVLLTMAKRLTSTLPRLILHIDFALEWVQVNAGQVLFHDGNESDAIYIVLNGRLRLVEDKKDGGMAALAEYGQGESIGELEVLTETARSGTLHAIRDTELVKFPRTLFNSLAKEHPNITIKISKIIASRMRAAVDEPSRNSGKQAGSGAIHSSRKSTMNLRTVAILPVTAGVPVVEFGNRLMNALAQVGPPNGATSLNQAAILNHLGKHAFNKMGKLRLSQYLADLEEKYGLVVYVAGKPIPSIVLV